MKHTFFCLSISLLTCLVIKAQTITIGSGNNIFIANGTTFSVDSLALTPSANFNITPVNTVTKNTTLTHTSPNSAIERVFQFGNTTSAFTGTIAIVYLDGELNGIAENNLTLNIHNGSTWSSFPTNVTRDAVNNIVTTTNLTNISLNELTLASALAPLPVRFLTVTATCTSDGIVLTWVTAQESNSSLFEVQSSSDGSSFTTIGTHPAAGFSSIPKQYTFLYQTNSSDKFYRIVEKDVDSRSSISTTVRSSCFSGSTFNVYPNPVETMASINLKIDQSAPVNLRLYDARGALVKSLQRNLLRGNNIIQLNMDGLSAGLYTLAVEWPGNIRHIKISKQ
jgi:Secretion system C-terminal sorting domain